MQRFLRSLNYVSDFSGDLTKDYKLLWQCLKKNPPLWSSAHNKAVQNIKQKIQFIPYLSLSDPSTLKIVKTNALDLRFGVY